jgi:thymidylate synthase
MIYPTSSEAYIDILRQVRDNYDHICSPRGYKVREIRDFKFVVTDPTLEPIVTADEERNEKIAEYFEKERELYDSCSNTVEDFAAAAKFWKKIANPDGTINSAYGYLIWKNLSMGNIEFEPEKELLTPWEWAKESLLRDKDTRQAFVKFSLPKHQWMGNKDQPCTMHGNFLIRDGKLFLTVVMRSNDVMKGLVYDMPWFIGLMFKMRNELIAKYPTIKICTYTHLAHSMHMYEEDLEAINKMIGNDGRGWQKVYPRA